MNFPPVPRTAGEAAVVDREGDGRGCTFWAQKEGWGLGSPSQFAWRGFICSCSPLCQDGSGHLQKMCVYVCMYTLLGLVNFIDGSLIHLVLLFLDWVEKERGEVLGSKCVCDWISDCLCRALLNTSNRRLLALFLVERELFWFFFCPDCGTPKTFSYFYTS